MIRWKLIGRITLTFYFIYNGPCSIDRCDPLHPVTCEP